MLVKNPPLAPVILTAVLEAWLPRLLRDAGYRVFATASSEEMRRLAIATSPDVAVVDGILEDASGTEACRVLRSDHAIPLHLPILLVVDRPPSPELRVVALRAGVWGFVSRSQTRDETLHQVAWFVDAGRALARRAKESSCSDRTDFRMRLELETLVPEPAALVAEHPTKTQITSSSVAPHAKP
jgi:DNA-binding response OmpR family regulator